MFDDKANKQNEEVPYPVNPDEEGQQFPQPDPTFPNPSEPTQAPAEMRSKGMEPDKDYHGTNATKQKGDGTGDTDTTTPTGDAGTTNTGTSRAHQGGRNETKDVDTAFDSDNKNIDQDASETVQDAAKGNEGDGNNG
ncbi:hypothetical protein COJ96_10895 [Bacillus sp. AFS073361]|uniref:hypothetical protein n=1 Tax=Bacillus sp. AFS073361 TaxID=2033511 RepID=UPI000BF4A185|nr:hypothetical protein [Bacillus sp. AFS073361]PFP29403.1 hypothetical protein COJ96_10895 [Bacillus sp. AFS073361]